MPSKYFKHLYRLYILHRSYDKKSSIMSINAYYWAFMWIIIKACVCYFHQIFIFSPNDSPSKTEKCFLFHLKSSFHSRDVQIFVFLSFPLFLPVGHCFGGWSKINLKVHDVINCLNKNSINNFVWYLQKEKRCDSETLAIDGISHKEQCYRKIMQKMCSKSWTQTSL